MLRNFFFFSNAARQVAETLVLLGLTLFSSGASAPAMESSADQTNPPEIKLTAVGLTGPDPTAKIGDRLTFQADLKSVSAENVQVVTLKPLDEKSRLEEQGWYLVQGTLNQNGLMRFISSPLRTGELTLPSLLILDGEGRTIARSAPFTLKVEGPASSGEEKPQLIEVIEVSLPKKYWFYLGLALVGTVALLRFLYLRFLKNRRPQKPVSAPPAPYEPDHIRALRKIDELYIRHPSSPANLKVVSFGLSEIIKEFFSRRFEIDAMESTTDEMITLLRREALSGDQLRAIQILFQELDQYKFTKIEDYPAFSDDTHSHLKIKTALIIQKWALADKDEGATDP
ncbi:MAG: hypothetical protein KGP28_00080 [Bdellovibrionales bacterium]|nr:hypothetical protein [Bdellovibrionales bacterium]